MAMHYLPATQLTPSKMQDYYDYGDGYNTTDSDAAPPVPLTLGFSAAISLSGVIGNGIVLWYLCFRMPRNPFTTYILNLAIADVFFLSIFFWGNLMSLLDCDECIGGLLDSILMHLFICGYFTSQYFLTAISLERCLSVLFPIWYRCHRGKHQSAIVCSVLWVLSCLTIAGWYFSISEFLPFGDFPIFQLVLSFAICLPFMLLSNLILLKKMQRRSQNRRPPRLYILIMTTVFAYVFLSLPISLILVFDINSTEFTHAALLCSSINSSLNPVIYFLVGSIRGWRIRVSVDSALKRAFLEEPSRAQ